MSDNRRSSTAAAGDDVPILEKLELYQGGLLVCVIGSLLAALQTSGILAVIAVIGAYICYKAIEIKSSNRISPTGRTVLITGCDSGIGLQLAKRLNKEGFTVIATCLREDGDGACELKKVKGGKMHVLELDVTSDGSVHHCASVAADICDGAGLWAVVNNAGIVSFGDVELMTMEIFRRVIDVNLLGVVMVTKALLPLIRKAKGRVINVTSVKGVCAHPHFSPYNAAKFGVEGFNDTLRLEMRRFGVKVIAMEPGNFGGTTGLWNEENTSRLNHEITEMNTSASEEVLQLYGEGYLDRLLSLFQDGTKTSSKSLDRLMSDFIDALTNDRPAHRYMTQGSNSLFFDLDVILTVLRNVLPVTVHDRLLKKFTGIPIPVEEQ